MTVTWLTIETIYHFLRNESEVFSCVMDMRKAFDMVQQRLLLRKLLSFLKQLISCCLETSFLIDLRRRDSSRKYLRGEGAERNPDKEEDMQEQSIGDNVT